MITRVYLLDSSNLEKKFSCTLQLQVVTKEVSFKSNNLIIKKSPFANQDTLTIHIKIFLILFKIIPPKELLPH